MEFRVYIISPLFWFGISTKMLYNTNMLFFYSNKYNFYVKFYDLNIDLFVKNVLFTLSVDKWHIFFYKKV